MNITVIGTGYVGLVSGICFAEFGFDVVCVDNDKIKIENLKKGVVQIYEPGLNKLMIKNVNLGRLHFSDNSQCVKASDIIFIAVGTPSSENGEANLQYVYQAIDEIAEYLNPSALLVIKSTVPVGTSRKIKNFLQKKNVNVDVAFNPEFLKEGSAVEDFMQPDRVILGIETKKAKQTLLHIYRPLFVFNTPIIFTTLESAELSKYASNAFLAMKVTFINEIANLCEVCGADVNKVALAMGLDKRIGDQFLQAGPGYGGSCFPKDTRALNNFAEQMSVDMSLVKQTIKSNKNRPQMMCEKILQACGNDLKNKNIAILGVTFKANTDDMRDSPSIEIINTLIKYGANISIYDPSQSAQAKNIFTNVKWHKNVTENCKNSDAIVILTDWREFKAMNLKEIKKIVKTPLLIDLRNIYPIEEVEEIGFKYFSVGRNFNNQK